MTDFWHTIEQSQFFSIVVIILFLLVPVVIVRALSWAYFRRRYRTGLPLVLHPFTATTDDALGRELLAELVAYIGDDPTGSLAPGAQSTATPPTTTEEQLGSPTGIMFTLTRLAIARRPGLHVILTRLGHTADAGLRIAVMIIKQPRGTVIASHTLTGTRDTIVAQVGAFCVYQAHTQLHFGRNTPRWERWHSAPAYQVYREGLALQEEGIERQANAYGWRVEAHQMRHEANRLRTAGIDRRVISRLEAQARDLDTAADAERPIWTEYLERAAGRFRRASVADPANLLPLLARAAICEILGDYETALGLYDIARTLWPEQVESTYRLLTHDTRGQGEQLGRDIERMLRRRRLFWLWARTFLPSRWAPGERRYWASWLRPSSTRTPRLTMRSKRRDTLNAVAVARLTIQAKRLSGDRSGANVALLVRRLFKRLERRVGRVRWRLLSRAGGSLDRLLTLRGPFWDSSRSALERQRVAFGRGWVAQYNAAIFFSTVLGLPAPLRPALRRPGAAAWTDDTWRSACAAASIRHLANVLRDPHNQLDLGWLRNDPDLDPLAEAVSDIGDEVPFAAWAIYAGLTGRFAEPLGVTSADEGPATPGRFRSRWRRWRDGSR
ncbi:hypothetical protein Rhe02_93360 [Rhizocola hellebori]|uniref:Tetratricopeptide repeat protein n=1 Tax=Rhizocola hellebori TaxID=1392758 RepID=A0A8J3QK79_9ACTN|nr:hypothetical protein [Rhizocola hellebori]GIH11269.1 hypothetical protein Rhe02_93360 [Rhizocola hellebori]